MYKSDKVALAVCGLGLATIFILTVRSCDEADAETTPVVTSDSVYSNDYYVHNAGWFHASSGRFYPYVFNHYESGRGYYHDGVWSAAPAAAVASANPTREGAAEANSRYASARSSFSSGGGHTSGAFSHGSSGSSSRGGFGSTGHGSSS